MERKIEQANEPVPYIVHESDMARSDRTNRRLWLTINAMLGGFLIYGVTKYVKAKLCD